MKKIYSLVAGLLLTVSVLAQAPQKMSYQAVIRNSSNSLIISAPVGMQISILQGSSTGTVAYSETQTPSTNANGLASLEIGTGTPVTGTFGSIDWANGPYFIKTETDPTGGTNYTISGTSQLLSVPYALHAKTADNGITLAQATIIAATSGTNTGDQTISRTGTTVTLNNGGGSFTDSVGVYSAGTGINITGNVISTTVPTYTIGLWPELGGYVFWLSADGKHGLVAETVDQSISSSSWYDAQDNISNPANHSAIGQIFRDWRLPTKFELNEMYLQKFDIGGFNFSFTYWSSTEFNANDAWGQGFSFGAPANVTKTISTVYVRSVRAF